MFNASQHDVAAMLVNSLPRAIKQPRYSKPKSDNRMPPREEWEEAQDYDEVDEGGLRASDLDRRSHIKLKVPVPRKRTPEEEIAALRAAYEASRKQTVGGNKGGGYPSASTAAAANASSAGKRAKPDDWGTDWQ